MSFSCRQICEVRTDPGRRRALAPTCPHLLLLSPAELRSELGDVSMQRQTADQLRQAAKVAQRSGGVISLFFCLALAMASCIFLLPCGRRSFKRLAMSCATLTLDWSSRWRKSMRSGQMARCAAPCLAVISPRVALLR